MNTLNKNLNLLRAQKEWCPHSRTFPETRQIQGYLGRRPAKEAVLTWAFDMGKWSLTRSLYIDLVAQLGARSSDRSSVIEARTPEPGGCCEVKRWLTGVPST